MKRYYSLATYFRQRFGRRVQKIPLDVGSTCPNRDGVVSSKGCLFCNARGSGTGLYEQGASIQEQWRHWRKIIAKKYKTAVCIAYLQSFSNTYGPAKRLQTLVDELAGLPGLVGVAVGTRPDCMDEEKARILADTPAPEIWLELGLQSADDAVLTRINRGHDFASFARAVEFSASRGVKVCAHVIAGLPGEGRDGFLHTVGRVNELPVAGIKFHNIYVCKGSGLAALWKRGEYVPPTRDEYVSWLAEGMELLRPELVVQRLTGDPAPGELLAPDWAARKGETLRAFEALLQERDAWQGSAHTKSMPAWFDVGASDARPPGEGFERVELPERIFDD